jgi:hypothetical protein
MCTGPVCCRRSQCWYDYCKSVSKLGIELEQPPILLTETAPNTYEAPGCQGTKISSERFFRFFSAWWMPSIVGHRQRVLT